MTQQQQSTVAALPCRIFYSTQSGRAKACARRTARIINDYTNRDMMKEPELQQQHPWVQLQNGHGTTFDDGLYEFMKKKNALSVADTKTNIEEYVYDVVQSGTKVLLCFISTTGDGEHTVRRTIMLAAGKFSSLCLLISSYVPPFSIIFRTQYSSFGNSCK